MRPIELNNGYMLCLTCRGYIEADHMTPVCECIEELDAEQATTLN